MNKQYSFPTNMKRLKYLGEWALDQEDIPDNARVYVNTQGNIHINWETDEERQAAIDAVNAMQLSANRRKYFQLKKEIEELEEKLGEAIREN